jgi:hypothetical protein
MSDKPQGRRISDEDIDNWFTYHQPSQSQVHVYNRVREEGRKLAFVIRDSCPPGADRTVAIRKLLETIMAANQAIACDPESQ